MPSGFHDVRLPDRIESGAQGGPMFSTTVIEFTSGQEQRNVEWSLAKLEWDISYGIQDAADYSEVLNFFYARFGRAYGFRFKDWTDYRVTGQELGTGDGANTFFQLIKTYSDAASTYTRTITRPISATVLVYKDTGGGPVLQVSGYSLNDATGLITFSPAPAMGAVISSSFEFDVPVRFDLDKMVVTIDWVDAGIIPTIPIKEIRPGT